MGDKISHDAISIRRHGFFGPAMLPMSEAQYMGIAEKPESLNKRLGVRAAAPLRVQAGD